MDMNKNQYVDSVMRVLGNSSIELYTYEYDVFQSELESEYDKVLERRELYKSRISDLAQRISESAKAAMRNHVVGSCV